MEEIRICPDCGYEGPKDDFLEYSLSEGTAGFVCPECSYFGAPAEFVIKDSSDEKPFIRNKATGETLTKSEVLDAWEDQRNNEIRDGGYSPDEYEYPFEKYLADLDETGEWEFLQDSEGTQVTDISTKEDYPKFKRGKKITNLVEYNYIGTDIDEEPRDDKSHKEKVFIVYDKYGEIGEYHTKEEAQKVIDEWYIDPELYSSRKNADLRIEEDVIDVLNHKIVVHDDLS